MRLIQSQSRERDDRIAYLELIGVSFSKKLLSVATFSNSPLVETQGSGYVIQNFARNLAALGHDVTVAGPENCIVFPKFNKAKSLRLALGMWRTALNHVKTTEPDIVEFYGGEAWLATDRLARIRDRRFKIVAHSNGIEPFVDETLRRHGIHNTADGGPPRWYQGRMRFPVGRAFSKADAVVTVSQPEADYVVDRGLQPPERVLAINNALPEEFIGRDFRPERPKRIGFCGSWLARKGVGLLARDMAVALREAPDWTLHLVGVGSEFQARTHFPADLLPRIEVTAFVGDKAELRRIYDSWAIALMPSIYESFGLVAAEAMACGCALVAGRTGFAATLGHEHDSLLLPEPESPHLTQAVLRLMGDEPLRRRIAAAGWQRVQTLRWTDSIAKLEAFYGAIVDLV